MLKLNGYIRDVVANGMNSMITFYVLNILIIAAIIVQPPKDVEGWLIALISIYFQGVALPALGAAGKKDGDETRALLQETHDAVMQELKEAREERDELRALVDYLHTKLDAK